MSRKLEVVGKGKERRIIIRETKEIELGSAKNSLELKNELKKELMMIRSNVKALKSRAEEIQEILRIIDNK